DLSPEALAQVIPGRAFRAYPAMLSTESEAAAWARAGAPEGAFVVAGYQASPRGRAGISWQVDHHHDLAFSLILRPQLPALREGGWRGESSFAHIRALRSYVRRPPRDAKSRPGASWSRKLFPREPLDEGRVGAIPPFLSALALDTKCYLCCRTAVAPAVAGLRLGLGSLLPGHLLDCRRIAAAAAVARYLLGPSHDLLGTFGHLHVLLLKRIQTRARRCLWWLP